LLKEFFRGRELMYRYKFKLGNASTIIQSQKMAANYALMDLCAGYHSIIWHNQRFYYNAEEDVLEPLVYDIFQESSYLKKDPIAFLGMQYVSKPKSYQINTSDFLFQDEEFVKWYVFYLEKFSTPGYFDAVYNELQNEIVLIEKEINKEYDFYSFNLDLYHERAEGVRIDLGKFKKGIQILLNEKHKPYYGNIKLIVEYDPIKNVSLHAYTNYLKGKTELQIQSFYNKPIEIVAYTVGEDIIPIDNQIILPAYLIKKAPTTVLIELNNMAKNVIFKYDGKDSLFTQKVLPYRAPLELNNEEESK
jgi:hypothetical protein